MAIISLLILNVWSIPPTVDPAQDLAGWDHITLARIGVWFHASLLQLARFQHPLDLRLQVDGVPPRPHSVPADVLGLQPHCL
jgi:hypothetical protein